MAPPPNDGTRTVFAKTRWKKRWLFYETAAGATEWASGTRRWPPPVATCRHSSYSHSVYSTPLHRRRVLQRYGAQSIRHIWTGGERQRRWRPRQRSARFWGGGEGCTGAASGRIAGWRHCGGKFIFKPIIWAFRFDNSPLVCFSLPSTEGQWMFVRSSRCAFRCSARISR